MKYLLSHFLTYKNAFTNDIFIGYENKSRTEVVAAKAKSDSQFINKLSTALNPLYYSCICMITPPRQQRMLQNLQLPKYF
jgi:hypothetical protein